MRCSGIAAPHLYIKGKKIPSKTFDRLVAEKQERLLNHAAKLFSQKIYEDLSIKEIIKHLGITTGSFYRYFGSKEELYINLIDREADKFHQITEGASFDLQKVLSDADIMNLSPGQSDFWTMFYRSSLEIRRKYYFRTMDNPIYGRLLNSMRSLLSSVTISDSQIKTSSFLVMVLRYIVTTHHKLTTEEYNEDEMFAFLQNVIITGLKNLPIKEESL